jgi:hypothetical protein
MAMGLGKSRTVSRSQRLFMFSVTVGLSVGSAILGWANVAHAQPQAAASIEAAPLLDFDRDVPAEIQTQFKNDLQFMNAIVGGGTSVLHQSIFGAVTGGTYKKFFEDRVRRVGMSDCGSPNAVACVIMLVPRTMFLTQNYIKFSHPQIARLMVIYHEARHTEISRGGWPHARCPVPFVDANGQPMKSIWTGAELAGQPACDVTPMGSYGSSLILLKNLQKFCTSCTEKVRMDAGLYADDQLGRVIDDKARRDIQRDLYQ